MKTLGTRLALLYCLISTVTLFVLLAAGYYLLHQHLVRSMAMLGGMVPGPTPHAAGELDTGIRQVMEGYTQTSLVLICLALLASLISGLMLSSLALRPVRIIQEIADRICSDNLSERIPIPNVQDEISDLARLLNSMFDRLESSFHQIRKFSAEASHELKTPLSLIRLQAEKLFIDGGLTREQEEAVQLQLEEVTRLNQIIEDLLFLSRAEAHAVAMNLCRESPNAFLTSLAVDARLLAEHVGVRFEERLDSGEPVCFDPKWLRQVLLNLITNALKAAPRGSLLTLESFFTVEHWTLAVEDEGRGVPPDQRERIFERFVRIGPEDTDVSSGTGLGLTICRSILGLHRGCIRAEAGPRRNGLRIVCEIPLKETVSKTAEADELLAPVHLEAID